MHQRQIGRSLTGRCGQPLSLAALLLFSALTSTLVRVADSQEKEGQPASPPVEPLTVDELKSALVSPQVAARSRALTQLAAQPELSAEIWAVVHSGLDDDASIVRQKVFRLYAAHPEAAKKAADRILKKMGDNGRVDGEPVWLAAAHAVAAIGPSVIEKLLPLLEPEKDDSEYRAACAALSEFGAQAEPALDRLIAIVENEDDVIGPALFTIQKIGPKAALAVPVLIVRLEDENFHHQYWACQALAAIGKQAEPSIPKLVDLVENGVTSVRRHAAIALGKIGVASDPVLDVLTEALTDPTAPVRQEALLALANFGAKSERALEKITEMALNKNGSSQSDAAWAWWQIDNQSDEAVEVLLRELKRKHAPWDASRHLAKVARKAYVVERIADMLDETNLETRVYVVETLEKIGPPAKFAKARLTSLLNDPEIEVREAAARAIIAVDGNERPK